MYKVVLGLLLAACGTEDAIEAATGETPMELIDRECKERMLDCQFVYQFETLSDNPLGFVEMCVRKDDLPVAESMFGAYKISTDKRFDQWKAIGIQPVCWYHCPTGTGCNSYEGCYFPDSQDTPPE